MRLISWNVNGIRAVKGKVKNGEKTGTSTNNVIKTLIEEEKPDVLCLQEVKTQTSEDLEYLREHYKYILTNFSKKKAGYSGVALLTNQRPQWVSHDFKMYTEEQIGSYNSHEFVHEGRVITVRLKECVVVTVYVPNSKDELARLNERIEWEQIMRNYLQALKHTNPTVPIIYTGDLNIAPTTLDIHDPKGKEKIAGFSKEEREEFHKLVTEVDLIDSFRYLHPTDIKFTYWSNFRKSRENNKGWRIDMFMVNAAAKDRIVGADCLMNYFGSDHAPILLELNTTVS